MIFLWIVLGVAGVVAVCWLLIVVMAASRIIKPSGVPTDESARINKEHDDLRDRVDRQTDEDKAAIRNAKPEDLLKTLRNLAARKRLLDDRSKK